MRYLIDACIDMKKQATKKRDIVSVQRVLGDGTPDSEVLDYAIKKNLILVTNDMKASLRAAMRNHPVYYTGYQGGFEIKAKRTEDAVRFRDPITFYALENDEVVIP